MNLKKKLLIIMISAIILPLVFGISVTYLRIQNSIQVMEEDNAKKNLSSVEAYIKLQIDNHKSGYLAWTAWDEYFDAISKKNISWLKENVMSAAQENSSNEAIIVLDKNARVLVQKNAPKDWIKMDYSNFCLVKQLNSNAVCASGLEETTDGLYIVTVVKLSKVDDTNFTNWNGYTVYARKIKNKGLLDEGKNMLGVKINIQLDNGISVSTDSSYYSDYKNSSMIKEDEIKIASKKLNSKIQVKADKILKNANNESIGILSVETESKAGMSALNQLMSTSLILILILLISVVIVTLVIINIFIKPIAFLTKLMDKLAIGDISLSETEINTLKHYKK
jgi:methyl-accepting chemotaxis protein